MPGLHREITASMDASRINDKLGAAVFGRAAGRVADGLDDGRVSDRSGAEANITACLALQDDPGVLSLAQSWTQLW